MRTSEHRTPRLTMARSFVREANSVALARSWAKRVFAEDGANADLLDVCALLVSEVATNAVIHGGGTEYTVVIHPDYWIEVWDGSMTLPCRRKADPAAENGRGLDLLELLTPGWQVIQDRRAGGKAVSFRPRGW